MKRYISNILCTLAGAMLTASCLNFSPEKQVSDTQVWTSSDNFALFANQFYSWTRDFQGSTTATYMNGVSDGPHSDTRSDLLCEGNINVFSAGSNSIPASDANYTNLYRRIYYVNLLLKNAADFPLQSDIKEPMGEAYFFRAYLYFELVQLYGDCIYTAEPVDVDSEILYGARTDRLTVIQNCIEDLKTAASLLPDNPSDAGRVGKYTAWAFLSRVALYEGTWQKFRNLDNAAAHPLLEEAASAAKRVIDSKKYSLFYNRSLGGANSYRYLFTLENVQSNPANLTKSDNKEYIFARRHDETLKPIGTNITHGALNNAYRITAKLAQMYRCQDGLPISISTLDEEEGTSANADFTGRDNRMNGTMLMHGQTYWNNDGTWRTTWTANEEGMTASRCVNSGYANYKWCTERHVADANEGYDYPIIRYAEVLLNYAEAVYERDEAISDQDLNISLNIVRARSNPDMTPLSNTLVGSHTEMSMREEIRVERTVELFMEGFRIDDLKRWNEAQKEMPGDLLGIRHTGWFASNWTDIPYNKNDEGRIILYSTRSWSEKNYLLPLPSDELQLNPQLKQNPGWE